MAGLAVFIQKDLCTSGVTDPRFCIYDVSLSPHDVTPPQRGFLYYEGSLMGNLGLVGCLLIIVLFQTGCLGAVLFDMIDDESCSYS